MKIVVAPDSFKGTMSAVEVANIICETGKKEYQNLEFVSLPVGDGGEGTMECLIAACNGKKNSLMVEGPLGEQVEAHYGILPDQTVIFEMAEASGLNLLRPEQYNPMKTSTYGTGQLLQYAMKQGLSKMILCIGGSATNDGGMGALQALGIKFFDQYQQELRGCGENLIKIESIDRSDFLMNNMDFQLTILCDVVNPFTGENGATMIYGPQKGATSAMVQELEAGMIHFQKLLSKMVGGDYLILPGTGAAGGLGGALQVFCKGTLTSGIDAVLEQTGFEQLIQDADAVITGEGKVDHQTLNGKVVYGVLKRCKAQNVPVYVLAGTAGEGASRLLEEGVAAMEFCSNSTFTIEKSLKYPKIALVEATERILDKLNHSLQS